MRFSLPVFPLLPSFVVDFESLMMEAVQSYPVSMNYLGGRVGGVVMW